MVSINVGTVYIVRLLGDVGFEVAHDIGYTVVKTTVIWLERGGKSGLWLSLAILACVFTAVQGQSKIISLSRQKHDQ